ncbi:MAG: zinc ribbon domain-containing protein [Nitrososphaerota archaeon]|nr:zinc ribbon domain-containing protein [Nitrososphaerota archaeon]
MTEKPFSCMKDRVKDGIIALSGIGAGLLVFFVVLVVTSADTGVAATLGIVAAAFGGWKVKNELDMALDLRCPKCRYANGNEANFCRNCGTPLRDVTAIPKQQELAH